MNTKVLRYPIIKEKVTQLNNTFPIIKFATKILYICITRVKNYLKSRRCKIQKVNKMPLIVESVHFFMFEYW